MKKLTLLVIAFFLISSLLACQKKTEESHSNSQTIIIGASTTPHAEILEFVKPALAKDNINLDIRLFNDYIMPNKALMENDLDANFFQHLPYLNQTLKDNPDWDLVSVGAVHMHPYRFYSRRYKSLQELPTGAKIISSSNISQHGHILSLFQKEGLIKIRPDINVEQATVDDIIENPRKLNFQFNVDAPLMPQIYKNNEADVAMIDGHFAINAGLDISKEAIYSEKAANSIYANIVVVRKANKNNPAIKRLMQELTSPATKQFIRDTYKGETVPVD